MFNTLSSWQRFEGRTRNFGCCVALSTPTQVAYVRLPPPPSPWKASTQQEQQDPAVTQRMCCCWPMLLASGCVGAALACRAGPWALTAACRRWVCLAKSVCGCVPQPETLSVASGSHNFEVNLLLQVLLLLHTQHNPTPPHSPTALPVLPLSVCRSSGDAVHNGCT